MLPFSVPSPSAPQFVTDPFPAIANFLSDPILGLCDAAGRAAADDGQAFSTNAPDPASQLTTTLNNTISNATALLVSNAGGGWFGGLVAGVVNAALGAISVLGSLTRSATCYVLQLIALLFPPALRPAVLGSICASSGSSTGGRAFIPFVAPLPVLPALPAEFLNSAAGEAFCGALDKGVAAWKQWLSIRYTYILRGFFSQFYAQRLGVEYRKNYVNDQPTLTTTYYTRRGGGGREAASVHQQRQGLRPPSLSCLTHSRGVR